MARREWFCVVVLDLIVFGIVIGMCSVFWPELPVRPIQFLDVIHLNASGDTNE